MKQTILIAIAAILLASCTKQTNCYTCQITQTTYGEGVTASPYVSYTTLCGVTYTDVVTYEKSLTWVDSSTPSNVKTSYCKCYPEDNGGPISN